MRYTYSKKEKLKSKKEIELLFKKGKSVKSYPLKLVYLEAKDLDQKLIKTGVSVSKRLHKTAVSRNRIKRLMREVYRLNKPHYLQTNTTSFLFMFLYLSKDGTTFDKLNITMQSVLKKFNHSVSKH